MRTEPVPVRKDDGSPLVMLSELDRRGQELTMLCDALTSCPVDDAVTAPRPVLSSPQHDFISTTIWLTSWLDEAWATSMDYLFSQARQVGIDTEEAHTFKHVLGRLRTLFAHNLDPTTTRDRETRDTCYNWFRNACGSRVPGDDQWGRCLDTLLQSAVRYLSLTIEIARAIEQHPDSEALGNLWANRLSRTDVVVDYLNSLQKAAGDLGCQGIDLRNVRDRYHRRWAKNLALVPATSDVDDVTIRYMEQALIAETGRLLPITARNVMEHLDLHPGELVAIALRLAQVLYALQPNLDHASLLEALTVNWNQILTEVKPHLFSMRGC